MLFRSGLWLGFAAVFLQIAVFLQPLLPEKYQISPVCETITHAFLMSAETPSNQLPYLHHLSHEKMMTMPDGHLMQMAEHTEKSHQHALGHECQYCTVYGHLIMPPELEVKQVLDRIQVRLIAIQQAFIHVWFVLQRLFLIPQGRAPPVFSYA